MRRRVDSRRHSARRRSKGDGGVLGRHERTGGPGPLDRSLLGHALAQRHRARAARWPRLLWSWAGAAASAGAVACPARVAAAARVALPGAPASRARVAGAVVAPRAPVPLAQATAAVPDRTGTMEG